MGGSFAPIAVLTQAAHNFHTLLKGPRMTEQEILVHNEQIKLTAGFANGIALAIIFVIGYGGFVSSTQLTGLSLTTLAFGAFMLLAAVYIHWLARNLLISLRVHTEEPP